MPETTTRQLHISVSKEYLTSTQVIFVFYRQNRQFLSYILWNLGSDLVIFLGATDCYVTKEEGLLFVNTLSDSNFFLNEEYMYLYLYLQA